MAFIEAHAERMRRSPTPAEAKLWDALKPLGFERQVPMRIRRLKSWRYDLYILDFYNSARKLAIEVDGSIHRKRKGRDGRRDRRLSAHGIQTLRIWNDEVLNDLEATLTLIRYAGEGTK
jgi:very-short-patch-repair endonuclease